MVSQWQKALPHAPDTACITGDFGELKTAGIYSVDETHLSISPILNAAVQMTLSRNSGWSR